MKTFFWKITMLPKAQIPLMKLYFRYMKHAELHTSISAWVSVPSDIFSNISSSMYSLCTPAETANPQINACTTTLSGRLSYFISFSAHCVSAVPWLEAVVAWSLISEVQQQKIWIQGTTQVLCHDHGVTLTRFFSWTGCFPGCFPPGSFARVLLSLSAGRLGHHAPSQAAPLHCVLQPGQMCSAIPWDAFPAGAAGSLPSLLLLSATAFPGTPSRLSQDPRLAVLLHAQRQMLKGVLLELLAIFVRSVCSTECFPAVSSCLEQGKSQSFGSQV